MFRRLSLSALIITSAAASVSAQDVLHSFISKLSAAPASFEYSFVTKNSATPFSGSGNASVEGKCYRIVGNGLDIRCDGSERWTADTEAGEMIIESVDSTALDFISNPALIFIGLDECFEVESSTDKVFILTPKIENSGIRSLSLTFTGANPSSAILLHADGSRTEFTLSGFEFSVKDEPWFFSKTDLASFKTVTDLR